MEREHTSMSLGGCWIWLDPVRFPDAQRARVSAFAPDDIQPGMAVFRSVRRFGRVPERVTVRFTGDSKYRLWINGRFVDDGPVEVGGDYGNREAPDWWFYDERDLAPYLRAGENVLVAEVFTVGFAQTDYSTGRPGFAFAAEIDDEAAWVSDESWRSLLHPGSRERAGWRADLYDNDYHAADFDDTDWIPAVRLDAAEAAARWQLEKLDLPPLAESILAPSAVEFPFPEHARRVDGARDFLSGAGPLVIRLDHPVVFLFRFPDEVAAHLEWEVESDAPVRLAFECQEYPGVGYHTEHYRTGPGRRSRFRAPRLNTLYCVQVRVENAGFSVTRPMVRLHRVVAHARAFPAPPTAPFACSDPGLVRVRDLCDRTLRLCMQRLHLDSPVHQEGLGCTGDYRIEALMAQALYGETRLAAADLRRTARLLRQKNGVMFHTSYSLLFVDMLRETFLYGGDRALLDDCFLAAERVLELFKDYLGPEGLVSEAPNYMFIDWVEDGGFNYHHPPAGRGMGAMTAFYFGALTAGAEVADWFGRSETARIWRARADCLRENFHARLWDPARGCYRDGIPGLTRVSPSRRLPADDGGVAYSTQTNALALAHGLAPTSMRGALLEKVLTAQALVPAQMYFMHYVFDALHALDAFDPHGHALLRRWLPAADAHPQGLKEAWFGGDASHAWGGTPAYQITRAILGVSPTAPGYAGVRLAPRPGPLAEFSGTVPTPRGPIRVQGDIGRVRYRLPENVAYEISAPAGTKVEVET